MSARLLTVAVSIRPMLPSDSAAIDQLFGAMSPQNRYRRFHAAIARITDTMRRYLLDLDGLHRAAFVAEVVDADGRRAIGIGRYSATTTGAAEIAVAVADDFHRQGVGAALLTTTADAARAAGFRCLHAELLPDNAAALRLFRASFPQSRMRRDGDGLRISVALGGGPLNCAA